MSTTTASVDVNRPIGTVYNQWTQFESFPHFLHAVKEVTQQDDSRTHWVVSIGGVRREFDAEITEQVPDQLIAWASVDGTSHSGSVRFAPTNDAMTHVALEMMWLPESFVEKVGAALNLDERQAQMDLERFQNFIEERGRETGGWRGEIHDGAAAAEGTQGAWSADTTSTPGQQNAWATGTTPGSTVAGSTTSAGSDVTPGMNDPRAGAYDETMPPEDDDMGRPADRP